MYSTNAEYRAIIRTYFHMDVRALEEEHADLKLEDPESFDELLYDDAAMQRGIELLYDNTRENPRFCELYRLAAGHFISEDLEIGLCVLLTYDYFADFIPLYENPTDEDQWNRLFSKLQPYNK
jgi:hypothetical protein